MARKKDFQGEVVKRFRVAFDRPPMALRVSDGERMRQLRGIFADNTGISFGYIRADVDNKTDKEIFLVTFLSPDSSDPRFARASENITRIVGKLTPDTVKKIVGKDTGLDPTLIKVEEIEVKAGEMAELGEE